VASIYLLWIQLDLTLKADSMTAMAKLAFISGRPMVVIAAIAWLVFNIVSQPLLNSCESRS
jgi:hypothetical protein